MTITQAELDTLRFPVSALPGFDPLGLTAIASSDVFLWMQDDVLIGWPSGDGTYHVTRRKSGLEWVSFPARGLWLTMQDATTRFRVLRWIVNREWLLYQDNAGASMPQWQRVGAKACWRLTWGRRHLDFIEETEPTAEVPYLRVPGLGSLGYRSKRLPDDSWMDDAAALRLAALHVAGRPWKPPLPYVTVQLT